MFLGGDAKMTQTLDLIIQSTIGLTTFATKNVISVHMTDLLMYILIYLSAVVMFYVHICVYYFAALTLYLL